MPFRNHCFVLVAVLILASCGGGAEVSEDSAAPGPATGREPAETTFMTPDAIPEPVRLTEDSIESFLAAANELAAMGESAAPGGATGFMSGVTLNAEALEILADAGLEPTEFQRIGHSIGMAIGAEAMEANRDKIAKAKEQLEAMKGKVPDEQYEMMKQQMMAGFEMFEDQPAGNVELVARYRDRIETIGQ